MHRHLAEGTAALEPHLRRLSDGARFDEVLPDIVGATVALHALAPILDPMNSGDRENFELLTPLLAGADGRSFEIFSVSPLRADQVSMYAHLHSSEPRWWLS